MLCATASAREFVMLSEQCSITARGECILLIYCLSAVGHCALRKNGNEAPHSDAQLSLYFTADNGH